MTEQEAREMLPEVRAYVEAIEAASAEEDKVRQAAAARYPKRFDWDEEGQRQISAHNKVTGEAYRARVHAQDDAWSALKTSSDPLVRWIAENCAEYRDHARQVLSALPATLGELDALAEQGGWCGVWDAFRQRAIDAGAMPGPVPPSPARKAVLDLIDREGCCAMGSASRRRIGEALDALIQEALTSAASATEARPVEVTA
ncbi:hypothetical protein [Streptomyces sp. NPDC057253]|uniref:hypothetical protein n=1 Tax=Streptomyces sp. NPDC057253 TaxID=3346069 RepID=UPI0036428E98